MNKNKNREHHHRGKSSESLLDKKLILDNLNIKQGQIVLDAGCGNGYMAKEFAKIVTNIGKVYALDPDELSIDQLKSETKDLNIVPMAGDITRKTQIDDASLDLIYLSTVAHGFSKIQMQGFVQEIKRLLKPNSILAVLEINKEETPFGPPMNLRFSPDELIKAIPLTPIETILIGKHFYMQLFKNLS
ncbi:class I SAM-dependent methyltransferase [bacterium]|nr:class I SAM-dependent methyltransferase [bacterium]